MYIEAIILGLIIGVARNGRLANFFEVRFKGWTLSILAFLLFLIPYILKLTGSSFDKLQIFPFISMAICAVIAILNFEKLGMKVILLGILLNLVVMGLNDYQMPLDVIKMQTLGFDSFVESMEAGDVINYTKLEGAHPVSGFLGKVIALPKVYPLTKVLSLGDIIISIGVVLVIQYEMLLASVKSRGAMVQFTYNSRSKYRK